MHYCKIERNFALYHTLKLSSPQAWSVTHTLYNIKPLRLTEENSN